MTTGIQKTWNVLARTRNRAAVRVLAAAMVSPNAEVRTGALRALSRRSDPESLDQVLKHYGHFQEQERAVLAEALRDTPRWLTVALGDAVHHRDAARCQNACQVAILCRDYDLIPRLVTAAEDRNHPHGGQVAAALLRLANLLHQELRDKQRDQGRRDPFFARRQVLTALEQSLGRYGKHKRLEIVESYLLLVPPANPTLHRILQDAHHPCHAQVVASLSSSAVTGILELLLELIRDTQAPASVLNVIARRTDRKFLDLLLRTAGEPVSLRVLQNMSRLSRVDWLQSEREVLPELDGHAQAAAVEMAGAANIARDDQFDLLVMLLRRGKAEGRRASCGALADFHRPQAVPLVLAALQDPDRGVQAAAARQLRRRHVPHALERLVEMLNSPAAEVRDAARASLSEFNFARYQASFDLLDNDSRQTAGRLAFQVDATAKPRLAHLLASPSISARQRAIEMIVAMGAEDAMGDQLQAALIDANVAVRAAAAVALARSSHADVIPALEKAAADEHRSVREAAEQSLTELRARLLHDVDCRAATGRTTE
jgi:HEAT repeat protein